LVPPHNGAIVVSTPSKTCVIGVSSTQATAVNSTIIDNLSDAVICSFFASHPNSLQLDNEDLQKIHLDDLEEMDLGWQMAMLTIRARRFLKNTRRKFYLNENETIRFDKSKVECYNYHKRGHFARKCRAPRSQDTKHKESTRRTVSVETPASTSLVCDGLGGYDWSDQAEDGLTNFALMDYSFTSSNSKTREAKACADKPKDVRKNFGPPLIEDWIADSEDEAESKSKIKKENVKPSFAKINFVKSKEQVKTPRKTTVKQIMNKLIEDILPLEVTPKEGKSQAGADEGFFVGYSLNSKAFRVFSNRTRIVKENLHVRVNAIGANTNNELPFYPKMHALEDISTFNFSSDQEDADEEADMNNMDTTIQIKEEVYVCQPLGFKDPDFPDKVYKVEKASYGLHQAPRACQDKYVAEILKKYGFFKVKNVSTPMETQKALLKDEDGKEVDVYMYRSMIGSLMIFKYLKGQPKFDLWYPKDSPFDLAAYTDSDYAGASLNRKSTTRDITYYCWADANAVEVSTLKFAEVHNLVAFLSKPIECEGFEKIVDFLNANPIKYALTVNPIVYTSCIEQFWATVKAKTINREGQLQALVDGKKIIITESTIRRDLQLEDAKGVDCLPNTVIFERLTLIGTMASLIIYLSTNQKFNFSKNIFESMVKNLNNVNKFLMYPRTWGEGLTNPTDPHHTPTIIQPLTSQPQRLRKTKRKDTELPQISVPTSVADEAVNEEMDDSLERAAITATSLDEESERVSKISNDILLTGVNIPRNGEDSLKLTELMKFCTNLQQSVLNLEITKTTQALEIDNLKRRVKKLERRTRSRTHGLKRLYKVGLSARVESSEDEGLGEEDASKHWRITDINASEDITLVNTYEEQMFDIDQDLGSEEVFVAQQDENVVKKEVDAAQIQLDEEVALKLHTELQAKFNKEQRIAKERAQQEVEANIALIESYDDVQAKIDADYQLAESLQAKEQQELNDEEKAKLFMQLLEKRRKFCKERKKLTDLKNKSFESIRKMFDRTFKRVNTFVDYKTKLVEESSKKAEEEVTEGSSKRAGTELEQESVKKQKIDKETTELQELVKIIPDEEGPEGDYERVLWGDLKVMFEPHIKDEVWKMQQRYKVKDYGTKRGIHSTSTSSSSAFDHPSSCYHVDEDDNKNDEDAPLRPSNPLPLKSRPSLDIALFISPITLLDYMFKTPSPPLPP
nr:hypothetical protein [Tanacetum cinerariifolium]